jgi:hypothetical protein
MASWWSSGIAARAASFQPWRKLWNTFLGSVIPRLRTWRDQYFDRAAVRLNRVPFNSGNKRTGPSTLCLSTNAREAHLDQLQVNRHSTPVALRFDPLAVTRLDGEVVNAVFLSNVRHSKLTQLFEPCPGVERQPGEPVIGVALSPDEKISLRSCGL